MRDIRNLAASKGRGSLDADSVLTILGRRAGRRHAEPIDEAREEHDDGEVSDVSPDFPAPHG